MGLNHAAQMRGDDGAGIDHRVAKRLRLLAFRGLDPDRFHSKCGIARLDAGRLAEHPARIDRELAIRVDHAVGQHYARKTDAIGVGRELEVVADVHRLHQEAELLRELATHATDSRQQFPALGLVDQRYQPETDLDSDQIDRLHILPRQFALLRRHRGPVRTGRARCRSHCGQLLGATLQQPRPAPAGGGEQQKSGVGHARDQTHDAEHAASDREAQRLAQQLSGQFVAEVLCLGHAGDNDRDAGGQQQCRDLSDQTVTDGQQRVDVGRIGKAHAVAQRAYPEATDDVDEQNQDARGRIATHELAGAVHRAVKIRFRAHLRASQARLILIDEPGIEIGVDRHLLAGHGIESEARADLGDAARALGHDHEIDDGQDREHDDADRIIAADHELAERLDDVSGRRSAFMPVQQHDPRRGHVERQAQQGRQQQHGREDAEIQRPRDVHDRHNHQHRQCDVESEQHVERQRRQRQDHHGQHGQQQQRCADAPLQQQSQRCADPSRGCVDGEFSHAGLVEQFLCRRRPTNYRRFGSRRASQNASAAQGSSGRSTLGGAGRGPP